MCLARGVQEKAAGAEVMNTANLCAISIDFILMHCNLSVCMHSFKPTLFCL